VNISCSLSNPIRAPNLNNPERADKDRDNRV
jgi:hypothetical protein